MAHSSNSAMADNVRHAATRVYRTVCRWCNCWSEKALQTIIHNRVSRGGILAKGAGLVKHGENGKGLASQWYPQTLSKRIRALHAIRERVSFIWGDGIDVIEQHIHRADAVFFIDPPSMQYV